MTACISCQHFTLRPRAGEGEEHYRASDIAHARVGMGRCGKEALAMRWLAAEEPRACAKHEAASVEQTAARREWMAKAKVAP